MINDYSHDHAETRRSFLRAMSAAALTTLAGNAPRNAFADEPLQHPAARADTCILLWMGGGMAGPETFDPKRYTPFEIGVPSEKILCTFPSIDTAVDNIKISAGLENIAQVMDRATLLRGHVVADLGSILHSRHQYHWHTGYVPPQTVAAPHLGSWIAKVRGPNNPALPAFINIGQRLEGVGESEELKAFTTAGFFGGEFGPFNIPYPMDAVASVRPPKGMTRSRFENREKLFKRLVQQSPLAELASDYHQQGTEGKLRQIQHRPLRPRLPTGSPAHRSGRPIH
jgi:Protein of unknown function (DUF1501)